jgi:hypothetical protein
VDDEQRPVVTVDEIFERASRRLLRDPAVEQGRMLHNVGLRVAGGKYFAFVTRGQLVAKLPAGRVAELVASREGRTFDAGRGRPMKEGVALRPRDEAACAAYLREARKFVAGESLVPG